MRQERAQLGDSESQSPLVVLLGPIVIEGISSTMLLDLGLLLIAGVAAITGSGNQTPEEYCQERYMECMLTEMSGQRGHLKGHTRCYWCRDACKSQGGKWPLRASSAVGSVSCEYWRKGR